MNDIEAVRHLYYSRNVDLGKMREHANECARGDHRTKPQGVIIHMHSYGNVCEGHEHEVYDAQTNRAEE